MSRPGEPNYPYNKPKKPRKPRNPTNPYAGPGKFTIPGFTPDYDALLTGNSGYQSLLNSLGVQHGLAVEGRQGDIRRRLIEWGIIPEGIGDEFGDIDPLTRSIAAQANTSGVGEAARDDARHNLLLRQSRNNLAARGIFNQGAGGYAAESGREQTRYGTERFDKLSDLQDYIRGVLAAYSAGEAGRAGEQASGLDEAMDEIMADPENTATDAIDANHIAGTRGFYRGSDGKLYDQTQKPINVKKAKAHYQQMVIAAQKRGMSIKQIRNSWFGRRLRALGV